MNQAKITNFKTKTVIRSLVSSKTFQFHIISSFQQGSIKIFFTILLKRKRPLFLFANIRFSGLSSVSPH